MTIIEAINKTDSLTPNNYTQSDKIKWLSTLDGNVKKQIIDTHEGGDNVIFTGYDDDTALDTELLVPFPFEEVYIHYLESRIHYENEEYTKYNVAASMYNMEYTKYANYYNRNNMPNSKQRFIF